jgi:hypothetical protein
MKNFFPRYSKYILILFVIMLGFSLIHWVGDSGLLRPSSVEAKVSLDTILSDDELPIFGKANPAIQAVMAVQKRHTDDLMAEPGIVGTATGLTERGRPAILVFAKSFESAREAILPASLQGVPVVVRITGEIKALKPPPGKGPGSGGGGGGEKDNVDPSARFPRPVPIGVSTGHPDITAGTIGCRVTDGANVFALSNNHVYADENGASIDDNVLQPGTYDGGVDPKDAIGTLDDFEPIVFSTSANNVIDAAIALTSLDDLGNATPSDGYGTPKSMTASAAVNLAVIKYGRTTGQTKGRVYAINATVNVAYDTGVARFVNQIIITPGAFSAGGDSGSLIVVQKGKDARKPVGLLFAGSQVITIANPIDAVLKAFDVTVDGE